MVIAGEASGDMLAAELVEALRRRLMATAGQPTRDAQPLHTGLAPRFFGAGGPRMAAAGVELAFDLTAHSVIGLSDVLKNYRKFRKLFHTLFQLAVERQPDAIICVDFSGFNRRFAAAIRNYARPRHDWFHRWNPRIIQFVSPQVWASRSDRVFQIARDYDLLLSIIPFEREWYAKRAPGLRVEFVGHPMIDRHAEITSPSRNDPVPVPPGGARKFRILLLPGSRKRELKRHLPIMLRAFGILRAALPEITARIILPNESLVQQAKLHEVPPGVEIESGQLSAALAQTDLALASSGTVTMECALFRVPAVVVYQLSWAEFQIARRIVTVKYIAMPNLLAGEEIYPEFIQSAATPENVARAALELLKNDAHRENVRAKLTEITAALGGPGACRRAADVIAELLERS